MLSRARRPPVWLLAGLGVGLGLAAAAALAAPRVTDHSPFAGASGAPGLAVVTMTFSQEMRADTVEARFDTEPRRPGSFRWEGRRLTFTPSQAWPAGTTVTVSLRAGAVSSRGLPMARDLRWSFTTGAGRLAYLWPAGGPADLYLWSPDDPQPQRLTSSDGISDFSLGPDATSLVYTVPGEGGTEIREVRLEDGASDLLYTCPAEVACSAARRSPGGDLLAFVQTAPAEGGASLRQVMIHPIAGGNAYPVAGPEHGSSQPAWSSRGWLGIYDHTLAAYAVYDRVGPESARLALVIPNELGEAPAWSPDGDHLLLAEIVFLPETPVPEDRPPRFYSHLVRVAVADGTRLDLSGDSGALVEDSGPVYAPDGSWVAFSRRSLDPASWSLGRQLWRMRPDGVDAAPLTDAAELNHAGVSWSLDGGRLAFMVFDQLNPTEPASIHWLEADGSRGGLVVEGGYAPTWIP